MSIDLDAIRQRHAEAKACGPTGSVWFYGAAAVVDRGVLLAEVDLLLETLTEVLPGISWRDRDVWGRVVGSGSVWIELSADADRVVRDVLGIPRDPQTSLGATS